MSETVKEVAPDYLKYAVGREIPKVRVCRRRYYNSKGEYRCIEWRGQIAGGEFVFNPDEVFYR